jgi:hypothetical protein
MRFVRFNILWNPFKVYKIFNQNRNINLQLTENRHEQDTQVINLQPLTKMDKGLSPIKRLNHSLLHGKKQHPIFPPWQKNSIQSCKGDRTKEEKKTKGERKEISSRLFRIMASPPLTSSARSSISYRKLSTASSESTSWYRHSLLQNALSPLEKKKKDPVYEKRTVMT